MIGARGLTAIFGVVAVGATTLGLRATEGAEPISATQTATVSRGVVYRTVSTTGELQAADDVELSFSSSGELTELDVAIGDHVTEGQLLARIDAGDAQDAVDEAEADLASERARLAELLEGITPAESAQRTLELADAQAKIDDAETDLARAEQDAESNRIDRERTLARAEADLADGQQDQADTQAELATARDVHSRAVRHRKEAEAAVDDLDERAGQLDDDLAAAQDDLAEAQQDYEDNGCQTTPSATCDDIQDDIDDAQDEIDDIEDEIADVQDEQADANETLTEAEQDESEAEADVEQLEDELDAFPDQLEELQRKLEDAQGTAWSGAIDDSRAIENAQVAVSDAERSYQSQVAANAVADEGASSADVLSAQASVRTAQLAVDEAEEDLADTSMYAPTDGIVSAIEGEVGDDVGSTGADDGATGDTGTGDTGSSSAFITITDVSAFEVVTSVNETDIADIEVGQPANVSVDALEDTVLPGTITTIDPVTTASDSVVTYDVTVLLNRSNADLRAGMTVGVDVIVEEVDGALHVPTAAVSGSGDDATVTVVADDGTEEQRSVTVGIEGDDAVEIVSGLAEGDTVAIAGAATTGVPSGGFPSGGPPGGFSGGGIPGGGSVRVQGGPRP